MYRRILLGTDGSPDSRRATAAVASIAGALGAEVTVAAAAFERTARVTEWDFTPVERQIPIETAAKWARDEVAWLAEHGIAAEHRVLEGPPAEALAKLASESGFDLVVVGHRGRGSGHIPVRGSVASALPDLVHCPLMIVP
jgi:nucleotide-binding universal stress UspA family protein